MPALSYFSIIGHGKGKEALENILLAPKYIKSLINDVTPPEGSSVSLLAIEQHLKLPDDISV